MNEIPVLPTSPQYVEMKNGSHDTIAQYLYSQEILEFITCRKISTCHCYLPFCFKNRQIVETFCEEDSNIAKTITVTFRTDYQRKIRISVEKITIKFPDTKIRNMLSNYINLTGNNYYPG